MSYVMRRTIAGKTIEVEKYYTKEKVLNEEIK